MRRDSALASTVLGMLLILPAVPAVAQSGDAQRPALPSPACGGSDVVAAPEGFVQVGDETRGLRAHVPTAHDDLTPLPLIIWLHGQGMNAADLSDMTALPAFGEANDIVVVAPQGHQPDFGWMWEPGVEGVEPGTANRDVAVVDALIDQLGSELCLDLARVYATGYSIGGHGATALACRLSDRIAAIVVTAGFTDLANECEATRAVPMLAMAGTADEYILFDGGLGDFLSDRLPWGTTKGEEPFFNRADWSLPPVERAESIAVRQGCEPGAVVEVVAPGLDRMTWSCPSGADVVLLVADGGGHDWMVEAADVDANEIYWEFLRRFSLPT